MAENQTREMAQGALLQLTAHAALGAPLSLAEGLDFSALFAVAKEQALVGVAGEGLSSLSEDAVPLSVLREWQSYTVALLHKNERLLEAQSELLALCRERGIPAVILKGFSAAVNYPTPDLRASGDIDCLVPSERLDEVCKALEQKGFVREAGLDEHHVAYIRDGVMLEIHFKVSGLPKGEIGEFLQQKVFAGIFEKAEMAELYGEEFPIPCAHHQALVLLLHIAKHLQDGGVGLRQVLDFALFAKNHPTVFDFDFIALLNKCGLYRFTEVLCLGCVRHLGLDASLVPFCAEGDVTAADMLFADFLKGANFGRGEQAKDYAGSGMAHKNRRRGEPVLLAALRGVAEMCRLEWPASKKCGLLLIFLVPFWILRRLLDRSKPRVRPVRMLRSAATRAEFYDSLALFAPADADGEAPHP